MAWWGLDSTGDSEGDGGGAVTADECDPPDGAGADPVALRDATAAVARADSRGDVVAALTAGLTDACDLQHAAVWVADGEGQVVGPAAYPEGAGFPSDSPAVAVEDPPEWAGAGGDPSPFGPGEGPAGFRSGVAGRVGDLGVVVVGAAERVEVQTAARRAVAVLVGVAAAALERVAASDETAMATLHDATREMVTADSKTAAAETALDAAVGVLGLTQTGVHFHAPDERALVPVAWSGNLQEELGEPPALGPDSMAWSAYEDGAANKVDDLWSDDGAHNPDTMFRSEMIVPLGDHGVVLFSSPEPDEFDEDDRRFAEVLASNLTVALDRLDREADIARRNEVLEELTADVDASVRDLAESADQVSASAERISGHAENQAASMSRVAEEVSNLTATVEQVASLADEVRATSEETRDLAEGGRETADDATEVMREVRAAIDTAAEEFATLRERVAEIDEIVDLIDDVAEQTNILALNANIEAARAGEAGEGFAVVAEEVKGLAEETQQQAGRIETRVERVQADTADVVDALERAGELAADGTEEVERTARDFGEIVGAVTETAQGISEVADATDEQAASSEEIARMVDETQSTADRVAAEVQDVAAATQQQARRVAEIRESLDRANTAVGAADGAATE
jgi:methyl-accepting chemotaxis protein/putative methionine-R-sulfoxide reductase with GAF domain